MCPGHGATRRALSCHKTFADMMGSVCLCVWCGVHVCVCVRGVVLAFSTSRAKYVTSPSLATTSSSSEERIWGSPPRLPHSHVPPSSIWTYSSICGIRHDDGVRTPCVLADNPLPSQIRQLTKCSPLSPFPSLSRNRPSLLLCIAETILSLWTTRVVPRIFLRPTTGRRPPPLMPAWSHAHWWRTRDSSTLRLLLLDMLACPGQLWR